VIVIAKDALIMGFGLVNLKSKFLIVGLLESQTSQSKYQKKKYEQFFISWMRAEGHQPREGEMW
jgi:hypothetical protein